MNHNNEDISKIDLKGELNQADWKVFENNDLYQKVEVQKTFDDYHALSKDPLCYYIRGSLYKNHNEQSKFEFQVNHIITPESLSEELVKIYSFINDGSLKISEVKLKLEKIKIVENIIYDYRTKYQNTNKKDHNLMNELINNLQNISILPYIGLISGENRENFYNNILTEKERKDNNLIDEYSIRKYLESDPVYAILTGSTPDPNMKQIIDDKKLSKLLVEISQ